MSGITFIRYYRFRNIEKNSYRHFSRKPKEKPTLSLNFTFHYIRCLFNKSFHRYGPLFHTKQQAILIPVFTLKTNTQICVYNGYYMQPYTWYLDSVILFPNVELKAWKRLITDTQSTRNLTKTLPYKDGIIYVLNKEL